MRRSLLVLLAAGAGAFPACARAEPVLVLGHNGRAHKRNDPFVTGPALTPVPDQTATTASTHAGRKHAGPTVTTVLKRLYQSHAITQATYRQDSAAFNQALGTEQHLSGARRAELDAVANTVHQMAVAGQLNPSRLPAVFETVARNRQWWASGPFPATDQRVEFAGSQLLWEFYPGQGIQLQVLGNFGKADGLYSAGPSHYGTLQQLLSEMVPLAAQRGGGRTWEYYFSFDGSTPPWTSAMSQATGLEALSRAFQATKNRYYLNIASQALPVFHVPPPVGVSEHTGRGTRYLQYSFAPRTLIINAFLQTLIGLYSYATVSGNQQAKQLFEAGNAEAIAEVPQFDTGAWSLYQPGVEDDLSYHELVTGFLQQLCTLTSTPVYCTTARHFQADLKTPPVLHQLTFAGNARKPVTLSFSLSKISRVGIVVTQGSATKFATSAQLPHGVDHFTIPPLKRPGTYNVRLAATDLAGNFARTTGTLKLSR